MIRIAAVSTTWEGTMQIDGHRQGTRGSRRRLAEAVRTSAVHLAPLLPSYVRRSVTPAQLSAALAGSFQQLGATYVKFGQLIASAPGVVGEEFADGFRAMLDGAPPVPFHQVRAVVESELGKPLDQLFGAYDEVPIAAASMAVVHRAELPDGRPVAVKVLRPGIERVLGDDLAILRGLAIELAGAVQTMEARMAVDLIAGLREQLAQEVDFTLERAAMDEARRILVDLGEDVLVVPEPIDAMCSRRVVTMEYLDGVAIDDLAAIERMGHEVRPIVLALVRAWFASALRHGTFHGDVHAGNLMVLTDGRVGIVDWGIVGRLDAGTRELFRLMVAGALGEESAWEPAAALMLDRMFGAEQLATLGITAADAVPLMRERVGGMLTRPFHEVNLSEMLEGPPVPVDLGERPPPGVVLRRLAARRFRRGRANGANGSGANGSNRAPGDEPGIAFDRQMFLLTKQLAYFERYGKLYLGDLPLLHDPAVFRSFVGT
jgi:predicted unusual protein kinase regulating ubiquinone biosynthesis (AarF/ABC1/UbiB family)